MTQLTMHISGMSCGHCVGAVKKALEGTTGVTVDQVVIGSATVRYDESATSPDQIRHAVEEEGYAVTSAA